MFEVFGDFIVPLMKILDNLPGRSGKSEDVIKIFEQNHRDDITPEKYTINKSGRVRWIHDVRWSRQYLKDLGFIDSPAIGIWRLTDLGHQWLFGHPDAKHLSDGKIQLKPVNSPPPITQQKELIGLETITKDEFFNVLISSLQISLQSILSNTTYSFELRSNLFQIRLTAFSGCHYEMWLRRDSHQLAIHFESSEERSQARLQAFEPHVEALSESLKMPVYAENFGSRGWTQVCIKKPVQQLTMDLAHQYTELFLAFVVNTYTTLQMIYANELNHHRKPVAREKPAVATPMHEILDLEVETIRSYLYGRNSLQPSDEKICDWVNFCYTFGMYIEGRELFGLVSRDEVNLWYFERTKKIAKACEQKAKLAAQIEE
jgi:hypothetical protein